MRPLTALAALLLAALPAAAPAATRDFIVTSFSKVRVDGPFAVTVTTGRSPHATATGDLAALDGVTIQVNGDTAVVSMGAGNWTSDAGEMVVPPVVALSTPTLTAATVNSGAKLGVDSMKGQAVTLSVVGSGAITVGALDTQQLAARLVGSGSLTLAGRAARAQFDLEGPGAIAASDLIVDDLHARSNGSGEAHFAARQTADVTTTGLGPVTVDGSPACTVHAIAGGPVQCGTRK